jgi:pimeloyl-ACP methyl ester carboxylesterase
VNGRFLLMTLLVTTFFIAVNPATAENAKAIPISRIPVSPMTTKYQNVAVNGINIFYREAGPKDAPVLLLLHGFPSSSRMFDTLIPLLANRYHLVAPDYPGFGHSDAPAVDKFGYTFDNVSSVIDQFTEKLGLKQYAMYVQDYGGPIGFRLALAHPERITALIVQNAVAHDDGLDDKRWAPMRAFWANRADNEDRFRKGFVSLDAARSRHIGSSPHPERYSPDLWTDEVAHMVTPGVLQAQLDLFHDYRTNIESYPAFQAYFREKKPPMLVLWGRYDASFALAEAEAYRRDLPKAEVHILDAGHFALDEATDEIAAKTHIFLKKTLHR